MTKLRHMVCALAVSAIAASSVLPLATAQGAIITTRISLAEFKQAYQLASVRRLIDPVSDGVKFFMVKRDKNGQQINFNSPTRAKVDDTRSFIGFRADTSALAAVFASLMQVSVQFRQAGGSSILATITCGLNGTSSAGVNSVNCGGGPTVSPS